MEDHKEEGWHMLSGEKAGLDVLRTRLGFMESLLASLLLDSYI